MIKFFSKGFFIQYATIFLIGLALWMPSLLSLTSPTNPDHWWGPASYSVNTIIPALGLAGNIIAYFIIFLSGVLINNMTSYYGITDKTGILPLFIFVITTSFAPVLTTLTPALFFLPFIILLFVIFLRHDDEDEVIIHSFDAGFVAGILTFFYYPMILLVILIWFALITIKGISWRNFVTGFLGWSFPIFLIYTWLFFTGNESVFFNSINEIKLLGFNKEIFDFSINSILTILLLFIAFISALRAMSQQKNLSIKQRNYYLIFGFYILIVLFIILFLSSGFMNILLLAPALAITLNNPLTGLQQVKWVNISIFLFILILISFSWLSYYNVI